MPEIINFVSGIIFMIEVVKWHTVETSSADGAPGTMANVRDTAATDAPQFEQLKVIT